MSTITFAIFTYNEEKRLPYVIRNFIDYGDVIILDGGSTDGTREIAEKMGAQFFIRPVNAANSENQENLNFIKNKMKNNWIYWGYADNIAPKKLVEEMVKISKQDKVRLVSIPLYTYLWGNTKNYALKSYGPFLFHKDSVDFTNNYIHGFGNIATSKEPKIYLEDTEEYALKHFSTYDLHKFVTGHLRYAEAEAAEKQQRGEKFSSIKMLAAMLRYCFIYGKYSYKNGVLGLIIVLNYAFFRLMTYARLYELENGITLEKIEDNYSIEKEKILKDFN